jgi:hypothetical protein
MHTHKMITITALGVLLGACGQNETPARAPRPMQVRPLPRPASA